MSEVLARIRVRETHGIRRFLYPLTATLNLPQTLKLGPEGTDTAFLSFEHWTGNLYHCWSA